MIRFGLWPLRAAWLLLPLLAGPVLADAFDGASRPVQVTTAAGLWGGWLVGLVATLVARTVTLTVVRVLAPAAVVVVIGAALAGGGGAGWAVAGLLAVLVTAALVYSPLTGRLFVDGSSYGDEARFPLRVPAPLLVGPVPLAWLAVVGGVAAGPVLLAAQQWALGVLALVLGVGAAYWGARALHVLARRWVVLVPAGLVLHDQLALAEPILLRRQDVRALEPAPADTAAVDLTRGALGLALEVTLLAEVDLATVAERPGAPTETTHATSLLFTPTQPGALLTAYRARKLRAG